MATGESTFAIRRHPSMESEMTGTNDNGPNSKRITLTAEERSDAVIEVENLLGGYGDEDVFCILMTTTINTIHAIEEKRERQRIEEEYIKAFRFLSAVEEQLQGEIVGEPPDWIEQCVAKMMRHVFRAIGLGIEIPE
jgi:hypothetical protein